MPRKQSTDKSIVAGKSAERRYWLVKSEPEAFSIADLAKAKKQTTHWDGVRNYQARNTLRDLMKIGDHVLYYHSNANPPAIVGITRVVKEGYPDHTALDSKSDHFDPKSSLENPIWYMVDLQLVQKFTKPLTLPMLREVPALKDMELLRRGSRLSVQPVRATEFQTVLALAGVRCEH